MSRLRPFLILAIFCLAVGIAKPVSCHAGIGIASSEAILVDTAKPSLDLDELPIYLRVIAGEQYDFHWTSHDLHPGLTEDDFQAVLLVDQESIENITWYPEFEEYTWNWTCPEIQSANCQVEVTVRDMMGNTTVEISDFFTVLYSTTAVDEVPIAVNFPAPFPNPFNPSCEVAFSLPAAENVDLSIFDTRGRKVITLINGAMPSGTTTVRWNGCDQQDRPQPGGVYFFVLNTPSADGPMKIVRKATLIP